MSAKSNLLISIAMATYNGEKYLIRQLESIINQTYKNIEIIIVDDCSSDGTMSIIKDFASKYNFIKYSQNLKNSGVAKTFEKAISLCNGDYIALSDQDDNWFKNKLEALLGHVKDNLLIHSETVLIDKNNNIIEKSNYTKIKYASKSDFIDYLWSNNLHGCTAMFKRKLIDLCFPIPNEFYVHDHYLAICAAYYGSITLYNKPLVYYRQHFSNTTEAYKKQYVDFIQYCKLLAESYDTLAIKKDFKNNFTIELIRDYRMSLYLGKWQSDYTVLNLLKLKNGCKHLIFYVLMTCTGSGRLTALLYNIMRKFV
jgi:glycosyltransferase involved in cell wall biosynthesis